MYLTSVCIVCPRCVWSVSPDGTRAVRVRGLQGGSTMSFYQQHPTCQDLTGNHHTHTHAINTTSARTLPSVLPSLQVTWQKVINGKKQNVAIANPSLGVSVAPPFKDRVSFKNPLVRMTWCGGCVLTLPCSLVVVWWLC